MALYFDRNLDTPTGHVVVHSAWQKVSGTLAVCSASPGSGNGVVNIYSSDGERKHRAELPSKPCQPTICAWHPIRTLLAVGWESGDMFIWNDNTQELHEVPSLHTQTVTVLQWSTNGTRLASGDKTGIFAVWRADERGRLQHNPICRLEVGGEITQCIVPFGSSNDIALNQIASLAKAAVSGDEQALDHFSAFGDKKGESKLRMQVPTNDGLSFYVGSTNGEVHYVDGKGKSYECFKMDRSVRKLLFYSAKDALLSVSSDLQVVLNRVHGDGKTEELSRVKLSGQESRANVTWAGEGLLAAATADRSIRLWDLNTDDNYTLSLDATQGFDADERITCVAYSDQKRVLAAGTNMSRIAMWSFTPAMSSRTEAEEQWQLQQAIPLDSEALHLEWCHRKPVLAVNGEQGIVLLTEHKMNWSMSNMLLAVQTAPKHAYIEVIAEKPTPAMTSSLSPSHLIDIMRDTSQPQKNARLPLDTEIFFTGIAVANEAAAVWNGNQVLVYDVTNNSIVPAGSFSAESSVNALHDQSYFTVEGKEPKDRSKIQVRNFKGTVKQVLQFQETEGEVRFLKISGNFLVAATNLGFVRVYDLSRRDVKPHCNTISLSDIIPYFGSIVMVECNCQGSKVAVIIKLDSQDTSSKLYVYDVEMNRVEYYDFSTGTSQNSDITKTEVAGRYPTSIRWDTEEPRLLVCEAQLAHKSLKTPHEAVSTTSVHSSTDVPPEVLVVLMFSSQDDGILVQDHFGKDPDKAALLGLKVPRFYFTKAVLKTRNDDRLPDTSAVFSPVCQTTMRDFVGLEECDEPTRRAMLDFSFNLTLGNMDEAFKAIKLIKSEAVWESMAKMCVKTKRLDVAKVCLGRMGHVRGAHAIRDVEHEPELEARVAMLAVQLGMNDEAERLYKSCQRYDLLNEFYQATGRWASALEVAEQDDRVHLRTTHHNYAKHLELSDEIEAAVPHFEQAETHRFEVPRMMFDDMDMLDEYIHKSKDKSFMRWWAQYIESTGDMETAMKYYQQAEDIFSLVRVNCYCGNTDKAAAIANETKDRAACYHLARHYENIDDIKQAIHFFTCSRSYGNAIRICKEHGFEDHLMNLALLGSPQDMVEAATFYEERPDSVDKAVLLYHKAGHFSKALNLAFDTQQFGALESIAQDLDERADPMLLERCAKFFMEHEQYDKAVSLLVIAKKYSEAVDLCLENNVKLDENLVERLTVPKQGYSAADREQLLMKLADCCMKQGAYHLACKKYTQAGNKEKAMRALLKSGDTEKIIFFAGVSRSHNIYVMAANYLQSLDWRKDPEIMKCIINFYTKGRALDSLAGFYDACAQVEIDEYQNYDKALGAMTEAFKCLSKAKMANKHQQEERITELKTRIALVKKFIQAKRLFNSDVNEGVKQCQVLLAEEDLDSAVRIGDVYGLLIENHAQAENYDKAYQAMQEMRARIPTVNMAYYVNIRTIEAVHSALGIAQGRGAGGNKRLSQGRDSDEEDLDNGVAEEIYNNGDSSVDTFRFR